MPKAAKAFQHYARRIEAGEEFELAEGESIEQFYTDGLVERPEGEGGPDASRPTTTEDGSVPAGNLPPPNPVGSVPNEGTTPGADPVVVAKEGDKPESKPEGEQPA
jgi:hypothetical protein